MNLTAHLQRIQGEVREKTTPAERAIWYGYVVLIIVLPPLALILLFAGGHGSSAGIGLLIVTLFAVCNPHVGDPQGANPSARSSRTQAVARRMAAQTSTA